MKVGQGKILVAGVFAGAMTFFGGSARAELVGTVDVPIQTIYAPVGFDDNDQVSIVVEGYLPNSCYKLNEPTAKFDLATKKITVHQTARVYSTSCLLMLIPFSSIVNVGILPAGKFNIDSVANSTSESIDIAHSLTAGPDDYLYAPVDNAFIERTQNGLVAHLEGRFTNTCMALSDMKVYYTGKTIQVLPTMTDDESMGCEQKEIPFKKTIALESMPVGRYLLHVRSLNGRSLNLTFPVFETGDPIQ